MARPESWESDPGLAHLSRSQKEDEGEPAEESSRKVWLVSELPGSHTIGHGVCRALTTSPTSTRAPKARL